MNIPNNYFIFIDIFLACIVLAFIIIGYKKGLLFEIVSLIYTAVSILASWFLAPVFAGLYPLIKLEKLTSDIEIINNFINLETILNTIVYFIIIFLVLKIFYILLALILKGFNKVPVIGGLNRILGAIVGAVNSLIVIFMLLMLLSTPIVKNGQEVKDNTLFKYLDTYSNKVLNYIVNNVDLNHIKQEFKDFDVDSARDQFKRWLEYKKYE